MKISLKIFIFSSNEDQQPPSLDYNLTNRFELTVLSVAFNFVLVYRAVFASWLMF